ncbi:pilus assembly protein TadG-related protein [Anianabacter salinae]|uniref:pilus assembly protein TadG-related protein n=1 Tax=Anianabacter salinae TaxID=2851023 RepID=UPI00225E09B9|nr:VWA domain-containing protein [Anianabacter salinae]MBV0912805.1 VWA domain-containing protein [Anianabacter salinae]
MNRDLPSSKPGLPRDRVARFVREEDGTFIILAVVMLAGALLIGGLALEVMRAETARVRIQETADRAALAAASSTQDRNELSVVQDYFARAGLSDKLGTVVVTPNVGGAEVQVNASDVLSSSMLGAIGIESWTATAHATAIEAINKVEISLVLDVSGSMGDNNRLQNLKSSAKDFVNKVFRESTDDGVTVSVIPYSSQVSLPRVMADEFNINRRHDQSSCVDFTAADFESRAIVPTQSLVQTGHFDPYSNYQNGRNLNYEICSSRSENEILPFSGDPDEINAAIDALRANGNTSIDLGMKWGVALVDPAAKPVLSGLVSNGIVESKFSDRPFGYDDPNAMKIVVLMTDGMNTDQHTLKSSYTTQRSDFWMDVDSKRLSLESTPKYNTWFMCSLNSYSGYSTTVSRGTRYCRTTNSTRYKTLYFAPHNRYWYDMPYGETGGIGIDGTDAIKLTWDQLWSESTVDYVAYMRYLASENANDYYNNRSAPIAYVDANEKNQRLIDSCDAARAENILVFTIAFEAPDIMVADPDRPGQQMPILTRCATHDSYAHDVEGLDIGYAFNAVASSINTLRLTK